MSFLSPLRFSSESKNSISYLNMFSIKTLSKQQTYLLTNLELSDGIHFWELYFPSKILNFEVGILKKESKASLNQIKEPSFLGIAFQASPKNIIVKLDLKNNILELWSDVKKSKNQKKTVPMGSWIPCVKVSQAGAEVMINPFVEDIDKKNRSVADKIMQDMLLKELIISEKEKQDIEIFDINTKIQSILHLLVELEKLNIFPNEIKKSFINHKTIVLNLSKTNNAILLDSNQVKLIRNGNILNPNTIFCKPPKEITDLCFITISLSDLVFIMENIKWKELFSHLQENLKHVYSLFLFECEQKLKIADSDQLTLEQSFQIWSLFVSSILGFLDSLDSIEPLIHFKNINIFLKLEEQLFSILAENPYLNNYFHRKTSRSYRSFERLASFLNFSLSLTHDLTIIDLAEAGLFLKNKAELSHFYYPAIPLKKIENFDKSLNLQENLLTQLPNNKMFQGLSSINIPLDLTINNLPFHTHGNLPQEIQCLKDDSERFIATFSKDGLITLWNCELILFKVFEFNLNEEFYKKKEDFYDFRHSKNYARENKKNKKILKNPKKSNLINKLTQIIKNDNSETNDDKADPALLKNLVILGFPSIMIRDLLKENPKVNLSSAVEILLKKSQSIKNIETNLGWFCPKCTFLNENSPKICELCQYLYEQPKHTASLEKMSFNKPTEKNDKSSNTNLIANLFITTKCTSFAKFLIGGILKIEEKDCLLKISRIGYDYKELLKVCFKRLKLKGFASNLSGEIFFNEEFSILESHLLSLEHRLEIETLFPIFNENFDLKSKKYDQIDFLISDCNSITQIEWFSVNNDDKFEEFQIIVIGKKNSSNFYYLWMFSLGVRNGEPYGYNQGMKLKLIEEIEYKDKYLKAFFIDSEIILLVRETGFDIIKFDSNMINELILKESTKFKIGKCVIEEIPFKFMLGEDIGEGKFKNHYLDLRDYLKFKEEKEKFIPMIKEVKDTLIFTVKSKNAQEIKENSNITSKKLFSLSSKNLIQSYDFEFNISQNTSNLILDINLFARLKIINEKPKITNLISKISDKRPISSFFIKSNQKIQNSMIYEKRNDNYYLPLKFAEQQIFNYQEGIGNLLNPDSQSCFITNLLGQFIILEHFDEKSFFLESFVMESPFLKLNEGNGYPIGEGSLYGALELSHCFLLENTNYLKFIASFKFDASCERIHMNLKKPILIKYLVIKINSFRKEPVDYSINDSDIVEIRFFGILGEKAVENDFNQRKIDLKLEDFCLDENILNNIYEPNNGIVQKFVSLNSSSFEMNKEIIINLKVGLDSNTDLKRYFCKINNANQETLDIYAAIFQFELLPKVNLDFERYKIEKYFSQLIDSNISFQNRKKTIKNLTNLLQNSQDISLFQTIDIDFKKIIFLNVLLVNSRTYAFHKFFKSLIKKIPSFFDQIQESLKELLFQIHNHFPSRNGLTGFFVLLSGFIQIRKKLFGDIVSKTLYLIQDLTMKICLLKSNEDWNLSLINNISAEYFFDEEICKFPIEFELVKNIRDFEIAFELDFGRDRKIKDINLSFSKNTSNFMNYEIKIWNLTTNKLKNLLVWKNYKYNHYFGVSKKNDESFKKKNILKIADFENLMTKSIQIQILFYGDGLNNQIKDTQLFLEGITPLISGDYIYNNYQEFENSSEQQEIQILKKELSDQLKNFWSNYNEKSVQNIIYLSHNISDLSIKTGFFTDELNYLQILVYYFADFLSNSGNNLEKTLKSEEKYLVKSLIYIIFENFLIFEANLKGKELLISLLKDLMIKNMTSNEESLFIIDVYKKTFLNSTKNDIFSQMKLINSSTVLEKLTIPTIELFDFLIENINNLNDERKKTDMKLIICLMRNLTKKIKDFNFPLEPKFLKIGLTICKMLFLQSPSLILLKYCSIKILTKILQKSTLENFSIFFENHKDDVLIIFMYSLIYKNYCTKTEKNIKELIKICFKLSHEITFEILYSLLDNLFDFVIDQKNEANPYLLMILLKNEKNLNFIDLFKFLIHLFLIQNCQKIENINDEFILKMFKALNFVKKTFSINEISKLWNLFLVFFNQFKNKNRLSDLVLQNFMISEPEIQILILNEMKLFTDSLAINFEIILKFLNSTITPITLELFNHIFEKKDNIENLSILLFEISEILCSEIGILSLSDLYQEKMLRVNMLNIIIDYFTKIEKMSFSDKIQMRKTIKNLVSFYFINKGTYCKIYGKTQRLLDSLKVLFKKAENDVLKSFLEEILLFIQESYSHYNYLLSKNLSFVGVDLINLESLEEISKELFELLAYNDETSKIAGFQANAFEILFQISGLLAKDDDEINEEYYIESKNMEFFKMLKNRVVVNKKNDINEKKISNSFNFYCKPEEFANNLKVKIGTLDALAMNIDFTLNRKNNPKVKVLSIPITNYQKNEKIIYLELDRICEIIQIKIGINSETYIPSYIVVEIGECFEKMENIITLHKLSWTVNGNILFACDFLHELMKNNLGYSQNQNIKLGKCLKVRFGMPISSSYGEIKETIEEISILFMNIQGFNTEKKLIIDKENLEFQKNRLCFFLLNHLLNPNFEKTITHFYSNNQLFREFEKKYYIIENVKKIDKDLKISDFLGSISNNELIGDFLIKNILKKEENDDFQIILLRDIILKNINKKRIEILFNYFIERIHTILKDENLNLSSDQRFLFMSKIVKILSESFKISSLDFDFEINEKSINNLLKVLEKSNSEWNESLIHLIIVLILQSPKNLLEERLYLFFEKLWFNLFFGSENLYFFELFSAICAGIDLITKWLSNEKISQLANIILNQIINEKNEKNFNKETILGHMQVLKTIITLRDNYKRYLIDQNWPFQLFELAKRLQDEDILQYALDLICSIVLGFKKAEIKLTRLLLDCLKDLKLFDLEKICLIYQTLLSAQIFLPIFIKDPQDFSNKSQRNYPLLMIESNILSQKQKTDFMKNFLNIVNLNKDFEYSWELTLNINQDSQKQDDLLVEKVLSKAPFILLIEGINNGKECSLQVFCQVPIERNPSKSSSIETIYNIPNHPFCFLSYCENDLSLYFKSSNLEKQAASLEIYNSGSGLVFFIDQKEALFLSFDSSMLSYIDLKGFRAITGETSEIASEFQFKKAEFWLLKESNCIIRKNIRRESINSDLIYSKGYDVLNYYRNQPIYYIPSNMTISQICTLFFTEDIELYTSKTKEKLKLDTIISELWEFINNKGEIILDLEWRFITNSSQIKQKNIKNPDFSLKTFEKVMPILNIFEEIGNNVEFLEIFMKELFRWKIREKSIDWMIWIREIFIFSNIPKFFKIFLSDQENIKLLFELVTQEENHPVFDNKYLKNIYLILNNLLSSNKSWIFRKDLLSFGVLQSILGRIKDITKEEPRKFVKVPINLINHQIKNEIPEKNIISQKNTNLIKKGVGYSIEPVISTNKWSIIDIEENCKIRSETLIMFYEVLYLYLDFSNEENCEILLQIILTSSLLPAIETSFRSTSLLDMSKNLSLFLCQLNIVKKLSEHHDLIEVLLDLDDCYQPKQYESLYTLVNKLKELSLVFLNCLKSNSNSNNLHESQQKTLAYEIIATYDYITNSIENFQKKSALEFHVEPDFNNINLKLPLMEQYPLLLNDLRFDYCSMRDSSNTLKHHYANLSSSASNPKKLLRIAQELADLSLSLPVSHTNAIFIRCDTKNVDFMKTIIMGAKGTPYAHGAFEYHIFLEDSYPNSPPKVNLETTGHKKIRFNPNLYSCGKVCLSLLGTWRGNASENWDAKVSTLLQVLISLQAVVMTEDIYFNEPGFEGELGTVGGEKKNEGYSNIVRYGNVKFAMLEQLKKPSLGFETVIRRHFYMKRQDIINDCEEWLKRALEKEAAYTGLVNDHNFQLAAEFMKSPLQYHDMLKVVIEELKIELANLDSEINFKLIFQDKPLNSFKIPKLIRKKPTELTKIGANLDMIDVSFNDNEIVKNKELDINDDSVKDRWSRYIGVMGLDSIAKQSKSKIFLIGLGPLGIEIAKNLVLSGLQQLTIHDESHISLSDYAGQFFLDEKEKDFEKTRAEASLGKLQQLNIYVKVDLFKGKINNESLKEFKSYDLFILTENLYEIELLINKFCRVNKIKYISSKCQGVFARIFVDFGEEFEIIDKNGEESQEVFIKNISNDYKGVVKIIDSTRHSFEDGDSILIDQVIGMENINGSIYKIKVIDSRTFLIGDTTKFSNYIRNGLAKQLKEKTIIKFTSLEEINKERRELVKYHDKNISNQDEKEIIVHICFKAADIYEEIFGKKLNFSKISAFEEFYKIISELMVENHLEKNEFSDNIIKKFMLSCNKNFPPLIAMIGGMVSHEIIKGLTHKHTPINQLFFMEIMDLISNDMIKKDFITNEDENKTRSQHLSTFLGDDLVNSLKFCRLFLVGCGAIGCELLKNFAMISLSIGQSHDPKQSGLIILTDPDVIEPSNLNRQFLFREKHLRQSKALVAAASVQQMNPDLKFHIIARCDRVQKSNENIFNEDFYMSFNIIANALDNIEARQYVDSCCVKYKLPLLDSGTLGTKGHVQVIIPYQTESYSSQEDPKENSSSEIPQCTLKMFPEQTIHCVEWALEKFSKLFKQTPELIKKSFNLVKSDNQESEYEEVEIIENMILALQKIPKNYDDCLYFSRKKFEKYFAKDIKKLMKLYPLDHKTKEETFFWTFPKRPPKEQIFNAMNEFHSNFVSSLSFVKAISMGIPLPSQDISDLKNKKFQTILSEKTNKFKVFLDNDTKIKKDSNIINSGIKEKQQDLKKFLDNIMQGDYQIKTQEFEKDQDDNFHIDVIYSLANCRALNYGLPLMSWLDVKLKAGRIIPALASTTACIAGLQTIELVKLLKCLPLKMMKNSFINLAIPLIQMSEPIKAPRIKLTNKLSMNLWDRWDIFSLKGKEFKLRDVLKQLIDKFELIPKDIFFENQAVFLESTFENKPIEREKMLEKNIYDLVITEDEPINQKYIDLMITFKRVTNGDIINGTPPIRVWFQEKDN